MGYRADASHSGQSCATRRLCRCPARSRILASRGKKLRDGKRGSSATAPRPLLFYFDDDWALVARFRRFGGLCIDGALGKVRESLIGLFFLL